MRCQLENSVLRFLRRQWESGMNLRITKGMEQAKQEIVLNMLSKNMDEKLICDIAGLSMDIIKAIKKDNLDKIH